MNDNVKHPAHYCDGGIETIDYIRAKLTPEEFIGYCKGNALKYISRAGKKGDASEDLAKAAVYLGWASEPPAEPTDPEPQPKPKSKGGAPKKDVDDEQIRQMNESGMIPEDIAETMGVSKGCIVDHLKDMGAYKSSKKIDDGKLKALYTANPPWSITKIADEMGISPQTVYNHLEKMGLYKKGGDAK